MTHDVERELELDSPAEVVWRALTDPAWLCEWLADEAELELWPGGDARFVVDGKLRTGWVEEVLAPDDSTPGRLAFWWQEDGEPASRVTLALEPTTHGTRLRVVETQPLEILELVGIPLGGHGDGAAHGPVLVAA